MSDESPMAYSVPLLHAKIRRLKQQNAELTRLLKDRDGGAHDSDCATRYSNPNCNCGHAEVKAFFDAEETEARRVSQMIVPLSVE